MNDEITITVNKFASHCEIYVNDKFYISCDHNELNDELNLLKQSNIEENL